MATATFRSNGRRSSMGSPEDAGSLNRLRRSRSLSRYSGRFPPSSPEIDELETPRGRFVNKVRGSGFEISLDDLADEFFQAIGKDCDEEATPAAGRSSRLAFGERLMAETESSRRRGRSVSRHRADSAASKEKVVSGNSGNSRPRRSVSVSRSRLSESEVDKVDRLRSMSKNRVNSTDGSLQKPSLHKQTREDCALRRSMSQKDFFQSLDCYSSHSSSLTDDEVHDARSAATVSEKTIGEIYTFEKADLAGDGGGFRPYERKSKDQNLVEELIELEKSEKRKQDLLDALAIEEKRGQELRKIVRELLSSPTQIVEPAKPSPSTRRSRDKLKISKCLDEEAERYFEDFLSNVEDTDLSSFEGERSDTGSTTKPSYAINNDEKGKHSDLMAASLPAVTDGVIFPWLQWETSNSLSPSPCKSKTTIEQNSGSVSGSWSPQSHEKFPPIAGELSNNSRPDAVAERQRSNSSVPERGSSFDMDKYLQLQRREDFLLEMWEQRQRIASGTLVLCGRTFI